MMPNERKLNQTLRMLADAETAEAPRDVELALISAFRGHRKRKAIWYWAVSAGVAIMAGAALFALLRPAPPAIRSAQARAAAEPEIAEFYELPDADAGIPLEHATVVRVQLPVSELRVMGFVTEERSTDERVRADVLVGQDGVTRAVRFLQ